MSGLGRWMPASVESRLSRRPYGGAAIEYARYVALMMKDLYLTSAKEYKAIESAFIETAKVDKRAVLYHFYDLTPTLFEICLLGKHRS